MSRVNEYYNGYIVESGGLDDLRDKVLKAGTMNFCNRMHWSVGRTVSQRIQFEVGTMNDTRDATWIIWQILRCVIPVVCVNWWLSGSQKTQLLCYNTCYILLTIKLHVSAGSGHHQVLSIQNATRWCYTICVTVCWWRDLVISIPFFIYGYCYDNGSVGNSFGRYMKGAVQY